MLDKPQIFICYGHSDQDFAQHLGRSLMDLDFAVWLDAWSIQAGEDWVRAVEHALESSDLLLLIVSEAALHSRRVVDEWRFFHDQGKPIVPVIWQPVRFLPPPLHRFEQVNFHNVPYADALHTLHRVIHAQGIDRQPPPPPAAYDRGASLPPLPPAPLPAPPEEAAAPPEPEEEPAEAAPAEAIQFAARYPREVKPALDNWQPLLGYLFREGAAAEVDADAQAQLGPRTDIRTVERPAQAPVPEGALVTATPHVPGLDFNPPTLSTYFLKDWHRFAFEFRANGAPLDQSANGNLTFMVDGVIVGDVPLSIYVSEDVSAPEPQTSEAKPYRAVFCSYSHRDTHIVKMVEAAIHTLGYAYLRDATTLRSGEDWNAAIMGMIEQADIFQLFWSENAAESEYVAEEWRYALDLMAAETKDNHFIRPVCWVDPIDPKPPAELGRIHFVHEPVLAVWLGDAADHDNAAPSEDEEDATSG